MASASAIIPVGYKQTEVGVIPEDWRVISTSESCNKIQDGTHFSPKMGGNDFLYVTSKNIRFGHLDLQNVDFISESEHMKIYKRCNVKQNDLLLTKDGASTGNTALNTLEEEFSLLSSVAFLRFDDTKHSPSYFLQQFLSEWGQNQMKKAMAGNAITRLTLQKIKILKFPIPPTKIEQNIIAEVLTDLDLQVQALGNLIVKKRDIKQGTMQELLTAKTRLPGFSGEWKNKRLEEVAKIKTGSRNNQDKIEDGKYPFFVRSQTVERIDTFSLECEAILVPGDGNIGSIFHYINGRFDVHQRVYAITRFDSNACGKYILYFMSNFFGPYALENTVKATVDSLRLPTFQNFVINLPPTIEEQNGIAEVLSDMDAEIAALEQRLERTKAIKQGMMQQLLTGRIRLVEPSTPVEASA